MPFILIDNRKAFLSEIHEKYPDDILLELALKQTSPACAIL
jgi:hypothetical protein